MLLVSHARADIYVLGASFTSNGTDKFPPGPIPESSDGDDLWSDGAVWVAAYATATGHPVPISSSRTPTAGETPTNFARGGAQITSASIPGDIIRSKDAGEQWLECKNYLAGHGAPNANDIFAITSFGNDIINQYEISQESAVDSDFLAVRVNRIEEIINEAVANGFKTVLLANLPAYHLTPAINNDFDPATRNELKADLDEFNNQLECLVRKIAGDPQFTLLWLDMMSTVSGIMDSPHTFGFVDGVSAIYDCNTGPDPEIVMWWDCIHPTAKLHALLAGAVREYTAADLSASSDFNDDTTDTSQWGADDLDGGAMFQVTDEHLEYQVPSPDLVDFEDFAARPWVSTAPCYCNDWEVIADVGNAVVPTQADQSAIISLEVFNLKDFPNSFDSVYVGLSSSAVVDGGTVAVERGIETGFTVDSVKLNTANHIITPDTAASVRLAFNARSKVFSAYYDLDGSADGYTWQLLGSFGVADSGGSIANDHWGMNTGDHFDIYIIGRSNRIIIPGGDAYLDDFSLQMAPATIPTLQLQLTSEGVQLHWPASAIGYVLKSSHDLSLESWIPVTQPATSLDGVNSLDLPLNGDGQFFRLQR